MARRVIWTSRADDLFAQVLEFYIHRTKSKAYSRKLNNNINDVVQLLSHYPFLGTKTDHDDIWAFVTGHFKIFYEIKPKQLVIHLVWDTRQNPKNLSL